MVAKPLISVIMPCNRLADLDKAIDIYESQTYSNKELILVVPDAAFTPRPASGVFRYIHRACLGDLRNYAIHQAKGEIIIHFDSDDYYASEYISRSVDKLVTSGADLVGLNRCMFVHGNRKWQYHYRGEQKLVLGATMCYWRKEWENHIFPPLSVGEDNVFCAQTKNIAYGDYSELFTAIRHGNNTCIVNYSSSSFTLME